MCEREGGSEREGRCGKGKRGVQQAGLLGKPLRTGDCGNLHGIRARRLMPSSSGTFSSRNKREREKEKEGGREGVREKKRSHSCFLSLVSGSLD